MGNVFAENITLRYTTLPLNRRNANAVGAAANHVCWYGVSCSVRSDPVIGSVSSRLLHSKNLLMLRPLRRRSRKNSESTDTEPEIADDGSQQEAPEQPEYHVVCGREP